VYEVHSNTSNQVAKFTMPLHNNLSLTNTTNYKSLVVSECYFGLVEMARTKVERFLETNFSSRDAVESGVNVGGKNYSK
jgi:hypothetical protein